MSAAPADSSTDILADTKWVYLNMARLIRKTNTGVLVLVPSVLKEAPSNGAVGLANYAMTDPQAFFEKFVTKILPKDTGEKSSGPTEEEIKAELDPTFDELEKYIERLQDSPPPQT